ncbi:MAG: hypothetical protein KJO69_08300 [Gammaproteobacteria bacterium]|nr:hypothetical protein [Gammaproteobacteria bacterium]
MLLKGAIGLGIRERKPAEDTRMYQSRELAAWVSNLPKGNIGETSRLVYQLLLQSNQQLLTTDTRAEIVKQLSGTVDFITTALKKHYIGQSISLSAKQQKVANFSQAIEIEMAIANKTIVEDLLVDEKFQSPLLVTAINGCLYFFFNIQIRCYQLYKDLPKSMWHEIHILYQLAEQNQFHDKKVANLDSSISIVSTYKQMLLLATTNPNQLRQQEISKIAEGLPQLNRKFKLDADPTAAHTFLVNLHSDAGPFHQSLLEEPMKAHFRGFDLVDIVEELREELQEKKSVHRALKLSDPTQRHLLDSWGVMVTRSFARASGDGDIQISVGLAASHYLIQRELYGDETLDGELSGTKLVDSLEGSLKHAIVMGVEEDDYYHHAPKPNTEWNKKTSSPAIKDDSMWDALYRDKKSQSKVNDSKPYDFLEMAKDENTEQYHFNEAAILNISPGGFCLKLDGELPKQTQTGEIVGLLDAATPGTFSWSVGCIRWIRRGIKGDLNIGIQLIAPNAKPVRAQIRTSHADDNNYQRCLMLPAIDNIGQPETILTSPLPFREGAKVRLKLNDELQDIHLKETIMNGHSFKQFTFNYLEMIEDQASKSKDPDDFDGIWDII